MKRVILTAVFSGSVIGVWGCGGASEPVATNAGVEDRESALTSELLAMGALPSLHKIPKDKSPRDVVVQHLTFAPGDASVFHYHLGPVFAVITTGTLTEDDGCGGLVTHAAGSALQEEPGHIHRVINNGTEPVQIWATYIIPGGQPLRIATTPVCRPHDDSDDD
jgi:quercetin dioxygenase-like cupin family protein